MIRILLALLLLTAPAWAGCDDPDDPRYCGEDWGHFYERRQHEVERQYRSHDEDHDHDRRHRDRD